MDAREDPCGMRRRLLREGKGRVWTSLVMAVQWRVGPAEEIEEGRMGKRPAMISRHGATSDSGQGR